MSKRRVVVTGLGIISPVGSTLESAWSNVVNGVSGIGPITRYDPAKFPCRFGGAVQGFELEKYLTPKEARRISAAPPPGEPATIHLKTGRSSA